VPNAINDTVRVAVIGDRQERFVAQDSIETSLEHSGARLGVDVAVEWLSTPELERDAERRLADADAIWCAPGSPYLSLDGALEGIRVARESRRPFLGTCAGFQHGVIEFARNVLGIARAHHAEYAPDGSPPLLIDELLCSLVGQTLRVRLVDDGVAAWYGANRATEQYYCRFGLDEQYVPALREHGLVVAGVDERDGTTRILRLADRSFHCLTLFVPQAASTPEAPHPLVTAYLRAAAHREATSVT
jgi:CTP synthase (UTP-ammonia lyase)